MNFVNGIEIGGVTTKQNPSIVGYGPPTIATEGAVGFFYMDRLTGNTYKCIAAAEGVFTWILFSGVEAANVSYFGAPYTSAEKDIDLNDDGTAKLYLFPTAEGYDAVVAGEGAIKDYTEDNRPYDVQKIVRLHIENGISSIGNHFMHGAYNLKNLSFSDSEAVTHLGVCAFAKTLIGGEYDFSGLTDNVLDKAFLGCAKLEGVTLSSTITEITGETFADCHALRYVNGLTGLTEITGYGAFYNCVCLEELEITPSNVELGNTVFVHIPNTAIVSGTETPLLGAEWKDSGTDCFVQNMWDDTALANFRATTGKSSCVPIPVFDAQTDYPDWELIWSVDGTGNNFAKQKVGPSACGFFSLYHIYNAVHPEAQYRSFREFVNNAILPRKIIVTQDMLDAFEASAYANVLIEQNSSVDYSIGSKITAFDLPKDLTLGEFTADYTAFWGVCQALGWKATQTLATDFADGKSELKQALIEELSANKPVSLMIHSRTTDSDGGHAVAVLGYDSATDKFLIINSTSKLPAESYAVIYWNELEALISPSEYSYILTYDFGEEITMTDIDGKLGGVAESNTRIEGMIAALNNGFRTETGTVTLSAEIGDLKGSTDGDAVDITVPCTIGDGTTEATIQAVYATDEDDNIVRLALLKIQIPCTSKAKMFVLEADANTWATIKAEEKALAAASSDPANWLIGFAGYEVFDLSVFYSKPRGTAFFSLPYGSLVVALDEIRICQNDDGFAFNFANIKAGTYNWTAYYWDE